MPTDNRRRFMQATGVAAMLTAAAPTQRAVASAVAPLRIAYLGCGGRAQGLLSSFREHTSPAWVCDPDVIRLKDFQSKAGAERATTDLRQVLGKENKSGAKLAVWVVCNCVETC